MQLTDEQFNLIKGQFKTLKDRSPFYAKKFEGIDLSDVQTQADFEKLPFSEKADLREAYPLGIQAVPDEEVVRIHSSSGTTGTPVIIPYTAQDVSDWAEMFARCYRTAGITNKHSNYPWLWSVDCGHWVPAWLRALGRYGYSHGSWQYREAAANDARPAQHGYHGHEQLCAFAR